MGELEDKRSEKWTCYVCGTTLPSPRDGEPPITCLEALGGCGKSRDTACEHAPDRCEICKTPAPTRFFPADWQRAHAQLYIDAEIHIFNRIVRELERLVEFTHPWHSRLCAIYILETYFAAILPGVFYIGFVGAKSTGKTTCVQIMSELSWRGIMLGNFSVPYIARKRHEGASIGVDEYDSVVGERKDYADQILRHGYKPGAIYGRDDWKAKKPIEMSIYGPACLSFRELLEDALMSRIVAVTMARVRDDDMVTKVLANMFRDLSALRADIEAFCKERLAEWTEARVRAYGRSEEFDAAVKSFVMPGTLARDAELGAVMLLVAEIAGVDIKTEMRSAFAAQQDFDTPEGDDIRDRVKDVWETHSKPEWLPTALVFESVNMDLTAKRMKPYTHIRFARLLRDLGLREGIELRRIPHDGHMGIRFSPETKTLDILFATRPTFTEAFTAGLETFTQQAEMGEGFGAWVKNIHHLYSSLEKSGEGFTKAECVGSTNLHPEFGVTEEKAKKWLERALQAGEIYQGRDGRYRFV